MGKQAAIELPIQHCYALGLPKLIIPKIPHSFYTKTESSQGFPAQMKNLGTAGAYSTSNPVNFCVKANFHTCLTQVVTSTAETKEIVLVVKLQRFWFHNSLMWYVYIVFIPP
jgi:hypothetical protein